MCSSLCRLGSIGAEVLQRYAKLAVLQYLYLDSGRINPVNRTLIQDLQMKKTHQCFPSIGAPIDFGMIMIIGL